MYSEIKSSEQILINRLDENERIILGDIYKKSQQEDTKISFEKLTDESGDFGGVLVNIKTDDTKSIELTSEVPDTVSLNIGKDINIPIDTNIEGVTPIIYIGTDNTILDAKVIDNNISITGLKIIDTPIKLYYSISADEYKTLNKEINVLVTKKESQYTTITVKSGDENITNECNINLVDGNDTEYVLEYDSDINTYYTNLPIGSYTSIAVYKDSQRSVGGTEFNITEEILSSVSDTDIIINIENE